MHFLHLSQYLIRPLSLMKNASSSLSFFPSLGIDFSSFLNRTIKCGGYGARKKRCYGIIFWSFFGFEGPMICSWSHISSSYISHAEIALFEITINVMVLSWLTCLIRNQLHWQQHGVSGISLKVACTVRIEDSYGKRLCLLVLTSVNDTVISRSFSPSPNSLSSDKKVPFSVKKLWLFTHYVWERVLSTG